MLSSDLRFLGLLLLLAGLFGLLGLALYRVGVIFMRELRPEWNCVGLLGQIPLWKGQPVAPTWIKIKDISEEVELGLVK